MFYSHEILTSRKYGVATVWLVATLGAKSNTKKVTRKAILDVDVQKACDTIIEPAAPMALRLQSNLLYGVSRVYDQQCGYVLHDAQQAQNSMRALLKIVRSNDIDALVATKARPDQLMLVDDPAFNLDNALPALDFDFEAMILGPADSQQSMMSISRSRSGSASLSSSNRGSVGINLPSSSSHGPYQVPSLSHFPSSAIKGTGRDILDDEAELFQDDMMFEFDENGEMRDIPEAEQVRRASRLGSDSAASGRVRKEHDDAAVAAGRALNLLDGGDGDFDMAQFGDDSILPDAEAFPVDAAAVMTSGRGLNDDMRPDLNARDGVYSQQPSSDSAAAPQKRRKAKKKVVTEADHATMLSNTHLARWQREYSDNMAEARLAKKNKVVKGVARKNGYTFVWGMGLNGVGSGVGMDKVVSPLEMFSGANLFKMVMGEPLIDDEPSSTKHVLPVNEEAINPQPSKRPRPNTPEAPRDDDAPMMDDDNNYSSSLPELGREAVSALQDAPSSALLPWNLSASAHSHHSRHFSHHGSLHSQSRNRNASASPLIGRGSALPTHLPHLSISPNAHNENADDAILYGRSDHSLSPSTRSIAHTYAGAHRSSSQYAAEFEIHGLAAGVDTQTAASSQWVREVLDRESGNFWEFVRNSIVEKYLAGRARGDEDEEEEEEERDLDGKEVAFEELFAPELNSRVVAAQAFYHVLCLASKNRVKVVQDVGEDDSGGAWGEIRVSVVV